MLHEAGLSPGPAPACPLVKPGSPPLSRPFGGEGIPQRCRQGVLYSADLSDGLAWAVFIARSPRWAGIPRISRAWILASGPPCVDGPAWRACRQWALGNAAKEYIVLLPLHQTPCPLDLDTRTAMTAVWIDPRDGSVLRLDRLDPGNRPADLKARLRPRRPMGARFRGDRKRHPLGPLRPDRPVCMIRGVLSKSTGSSPAPPDSAPVAAPSVSVRRGWRRLDTNQSKGTRDRESGVIGKLAKA